MPDEQVIEQVETQAREMGWRPKEEFKGDETKWVDAATFVERGEHVLPIVKATAERLRKDLTTERTRREELERTVAEVRQTMEAMDRYHQDDLKQKLERQRKELRTQLVEAKKAGDVEGEVDLQTELNRLDNIGTAAAANPPKKNVVAAPDPSKHPDWLSWKEDNPWFGTDRARTAIAYDVSTQLRAGGETSVGRAYMDKVTEAVEKEVKRLGGGGDTTPSRKVESSRGGAGGNQGGNGKGKTYSDLPAEAKSACDGYEKELVGPNRRYKTVAEWRTSYATQFLQDV